MTFTDDEVITILKLLDQSTFDEMQLETDGLKLVVRRRAAQEAEPGAPAPVNPSVLEKSAVAGSLQVEVLETTSATASSPAASTTEAMSALEEQGLLAITAPNLGTFYRASKPDAPPFVDVGTHVTEGTTVCLLEVMKCFLTVRAKMPGEIVKVCAENAQLVEFGQRLFLFRPEETVKGP